MSMEKAIKSGKEHRKEYRGGKSIDPMCRNHGGCDWCKENRQYSTNKRLQKTSKDLQEFISEELYKRTVESRDKLIDVLDLDNSCGTWEIYVKNEVENAKR